MARMVFRPVVSASLIAWLLLSSPLDAQVPIGFERGRAKSVLELVSDSVEKNFHDPQLRGLDWKQMTAQTRREIDAAQDVGQMYSAIFALVERLNDSHTVFIPPSRAERHLFGFEAKAFGDDIRVSELKKGGRAEAAGLQLGDRIIGVNGIRAERGSIDFVMLYFTILRPVLSMEVVYARGQEPPRTVRIEPEVKNEPLLTDLNKIENIYHLIREAQSEREDAETRLYDDGVGYLELPHFGFSSSAISGMAKKLAGSRAVIIDLRDNPGGSVAALTDFIGHFESEPTVIGEFVRRKNTEPWKIKPRKPALSAPIFLLVNSESSSAAELLARHLQRTGRAMVIGDRTSGRVTGARVFPNYAGMDSVVFFAVQVAVSRVVFPDGEELEKRGVVPDRTCVPTPDDLKEKRDPCLDLALSLAREQLPAQPVPSATTPR